MPSPTPNVAIDGIAVSEIQFSDPLTNDASPYAGDYLDFDGDGRSDTDEFIAITNFSDQAIDISGFKLYNSAYSTNLIRVGHSEYHEFDASTTIQPGETIYVVTEYTGTPPAGVIEANGADNDGTSSLISDAETPDAYITGRAIGSSAVVLQAPDARFVEYQMSLPEGSHNSIDNQNKDTSPPGSDMDDRVGFLINNDTININNQTGNSVQTGYVFNYDAISGNVWTSNHMSTLADTSGDPQANLDLNGITFSAAMNNPSTSDGNSFYDDVIDIDGDGVIANDPVQFVEIVNTTDSDISLDGYTFFAPQRGSGDPEVAYVFGPDDVLRAGQPLRIYNGNYDGVPPDGVVATMDGHNGETVWANSDSDGGNYIIADPAGNGLAFETNGSFTNYDLPNLPDANGTPVTIQNTIDATNDGTKIGQTDQVIYNYDTGATGIIYDSATSIIPQNAVCFVAGTQIATAQGARAIENLAIGDLIETADNAFQAIRWIKGRRYDRTALKRQPKLLPIRIRAGALGQDLPTRDLLVSPQHRMLVRGVIAQRMFDANEVLVAAYQLTAINGIEISRNVKDVTYYHFALDSHEIVFAEGAPTESLYLGAEALNTLTPAGISELIVIFPEFEKTLVTGKAIGEATRPIISAPRARKLIARHAHNSRPLLH